MNLPMNIKFYNELKGKKSNWKKIDIIKSFLEIVKVI